METPQGPMHVTTEWLMIVMLLRTAALVAYITIAEKHKLFCPDCDALCLQSTMNIHPLSASVTGGGLMGRSMARSISRSMSRDQH